MRGFKNPVSAERFCQAYDEVRNFKSKFFQLKKKFTQKKLVWNQSAMLL